MPPIVHAHDGDTEQLTRRFSTARQRAGTSRSVVARIEMGKTSPTWERLKCLLAAAGFFLDARLELMPARGAPMRAEVQRILALSVEERLEEVANAARVYR